MKVLSKSLLCAFAALMMAFLVVPAVTAHAEAPYTDCEPSEIHPIWWKGKIRSDVQVTIRETGAKTTLKRKTRVTVTFYRRKGTNQIMLKDGTHCYVPGSKLIILGDACTPGDFTLETKTNFVNSRNLSSKTPYLIWVSTDRQSLNVFTGSEHNWTLVKQYKCSTGMANWSTPIGRKQIKSKIRVLHSSKWGSNLQYFLNFGGSGIHKWPGGGSGKSLGKEPCSHACVRLSRSAAKWCYSNIPVGTTMLVW